MRSGFIDVEIEVSVRKYQVDTMKLASVLKDHKRELGYTNTQIADILDQPKTLVEHWFRQDIYFAIPDEDIWFPLKELLGIKTDEFDRSVTTFVTKGGIMT